MHLFITILLILGVCSGSVLSFHKISPIRQALRTLLSALHRDKIEGDSPVDLEELFLDTPDLIEKNGFTSETHSVISGDGYCLTLHRIPNPGRPVVIVFHGLLGTSRDWVLPITGNSRQSLGLGLAQNGFDTWLFNTRGNYYSQGHENKSVNSLEYWDFSIDEQSFYDVPAVLDYIIQETGVKKVNWIGYSLGTTLFYKSVSIRPEYNDKINLFIGYACSPGSVGNSTNPFAHMLSFLVQPQEPLKSVVDKHFKGRFPPPRATPLLRSLNGYLCKRYRRICDLIFLLIFGYSPNKMVDDAIRIWQGRYPSSTSARTIIQIFQGYPKGNESRIPSSFYDFESEGNLKYYGTKNVKEYDLRKVTAPSFIFSGVTDALIDPKDSTWTTAETNIIKHTMINHEDTFSHGDYFLSKYTPEILYKPTYGILKDFNKSI